MFLFAHVGITLGASVLVSGAISRWHKPTGLPTGAGQSDFVLTKKQSFSELIGLNTLSRSIDIRVLMVGSIVPDIIDKPLAYLGFGDGRSIAHTLLVFLVVLTTAFYLFLNHRKTWLLAISIGIFSHLILDGMWATPHTLLWPLDGWGFVHPVKELGLGQIKIWWETLTTNPWVESSEALGLAVIGVFAWALADRKRVGSFLFKGKI